MQNQDLNQLFPDCYVNINGVVAKPQDAKISVFDRGFLYGDSIYEVTYSDDRSLLFFDEHLERLLNSAVLLDMHLFIDKETIINETLKTLKHSNISRAYIRIILTRGETPIGLDPSLSTKNNLIIIVKPQPPYPKSLYDKGYHLHIVSILRNDTKATNPSAKSGNYLNNVMAINEAKKLGADDAIMVNQKGEVTEGTTFNVWMVKDNVVFTPTLHSGLLKGITRSKVLEICKKNNIDYKVSVITPEQLIAADEVFITSSTKGIVPVSRLGNKEYTIDRSEQSMTFRLQLLYNDLVNQSKLIKEYSY